MIRITSLFSTLAVTPTSNKNTHFRFLDLPKEIRLDIYEWYMLDHVSTAARGLCGLDLPRSPTADPRVYSHALRFESPTAHTPALTRVCKQIASELRPIAGELLRFTFGAVSALGPDLSTPRYPRSQPGLPIRVRPAACRLRHLHLEWKHDLDSLAVPPKEASMRVRLARFHIVKIIDARVDGGGFSGLETVRITSIPPLHIFVVVPAMPTARYPDPEPVLADFEPGLDQLVEMCRFSPNLRRLEFIGIFRRAWLDKVEEKVRDYAQDAAQGGACEYIKVLRGKPCFIGDVNPRKKRAPPTVEWCHGDGLALMGPAQVLS